MRQPSAEENALHAQMAIHEGDDTAGDALAELLDDMTGGELSRLAGACDRLAFACRREVFRRTKDQPPD